MRGLLVAIARVRGPRGVDGAVVLESLTQIEANFCEGMDVFLAGPRPGWRRIECILDRDRRGLVVRMQGVGSREDALDLEGYVVQIPEAGLAQPPEGTHYVFRLLGLRVVTPAGDVLGTVAEVLPGPANDVLVIETGGREILLPMIRDVIRSVDMAEGVILVEPGEGMVD